MTVNHQDTARTLGVLFLLAFVLCGGGSAPIDDVIKDPGRLAWATASA